MSTNLPRPFKLRRLLIEKRAGSNSRSDLCRTERSISRALVRGGKMKKLLLAGICLALMFASVACSTIRGIGEDLGTVGGWVTKGSDNVREGK